MSILIEFLIACLSEFREMGKSIERDEVMRQALLVILFRVKFN